MAGLRDALQWLRGGPCFTPVERAAFESDLLNGNLGKLRLILPLALLTQGLVVSRSLTLGAARTPLTTEVLRHRDAMATVHGLTALGCVVLLALILFSRGWLKSQLPMLAAVGWFAHAGVLVGVSHLDDPSFQMFLIAAAGITLLVGLPPFRVIGVYLVGFASLCAAVLLFGEHRGPMLRTIWMGLQTVVGGVALGVFLAGARRRDFRQSYTIERQRTELEELNTTLEKRVAEQVKALTRRTDEVERLNTQLRAQVKDRSRALTTALRRLAEGQIASDDLEGQVFGERFSIGPRIAAGGMGAVYEGIDLTTDEQVAVKVILGSASTPLSMLERFLREAESAAMIDHPAIVKMLHVDITEDGTFYQVQEFVRGETLEMAFERHGGFQQGAAVALIEVLCDALAAAHACGVVHRDIKPANLMLTRDAPGLKVVDFGISKLQEATDPGAETYFPENADMTRTGAMMGTPRFMSPEQRVDASKVTDRADLYAVGLVALLVLRGTLLMPGDQHPFSEIAGLNQPLQDLLNRCLHKVADQRPSAVEVRDACRVYTASYQVRPLCEFVGWDALREDSRVSE